MSKLLVPLLTALMIGILVGMLTMWEGSTEPDLETQSAPATAVDNPPMAPAADSLQSPRILQLEQELERVKGRLAQLEDMLRQQGNSSPDSPVPDSDPSDRPPHRPADPLTRDSLIEAGVSTALAADIMRRKGELEYKKLQLRDRAIREGYVRSGRYYRELRELNKQRIALRDEIGDRAYDRYLYQTGQNNRVQITSIMAGSPAEVSGMQENDIILRYSNDPVFAWNEIRQATSKGELGEYVTVDILRDDETLSLMLPRGPLGVKLNPARSEPLEAY